MTDAEQSDRETMKTIARALPSPREVPDDLWRKYSTRAPRYTSYPTAPLFTESFDRGRAEDEYRALAARPEMSLYLHVPFCQRRCLYCGCHLFIKKDRAIGGPYVDHLLREAELLAPLVGRDHRVMQLALGGGTPNFLETGDMERLVAGLRGIWNFPPEGERSIEIDVRTTDTEYMDALLELGFNRFSLGVQDIDPDVIDPLRKNQSRDYVETITTHLRKRGVQAVNFDLMYGLPGQTAQSFGRTVDDVVRMRPSRVALFGYAHVPWMKPHQKALERIGLPDDDARVAIWGTAFERFRDAGYIPIGMDHFAEPDDELALSQMRGRLHRNFMGYTTARGLDLLALGVSSISAVGNAYAQNQKDIAPYDADVDARRIPWTKGYLLSDDDRMRRELIIDLFANFALDIRAFESRFGIRFWETFASERETLAPLAADGLLDLGDDRIFVHPFGRFFIRNICTAFDRYLEPTGQRYSKTV